MVYGITSVRMHCQTDFDLGVLLVEEALGYIPDVAIHVPLRLSWVGYLDVLIDDLELIHALQPSFEVFVVLVEGEPIVALLIFHQIIV